MLHNDAPIQITDDIKELLVTSNRRLAGTGWAPRTLHRSEADGETYITTECGAWRKVIVDKEGRAVPKKQLKILSPRQRRKLDKKLRRMERERETGE